MQFSQGQHAVSAAPAAFDRGVVLLALAAGICTSMQVGKLPPLLPGLREEFGLGLVLAGLVASSFSILAALGGVLAGLASNRFGSRRTIALGLALLGLGNLLGAAADMAGGLLLGRMVEGLGFVLTVVAAPVAITHGAGATRQRFWLGIWGAYMPTGVALGMLLAPPLAALAGGWRPVWLMMAALLLALALLVLLRQPKQAAAPASAASGGPRWHALRRPGPWLMAGCFACYTTQWFAVITWLPSYLAESGQLSTGSIGLAGALVVIANACGSLSAAFLLQHGVPRGAILAGVPLAMSVFGLFIFGLGPQANPWLAVLLGMAFSGCGGSVPATVLAGVPLHARGGGEIATLNGLVVQLSNIGSFLGPPGLAAAVAALGGWQQGRWLLPLCALLGFTLALLLRRQERKLEQPT
ncbi:CynX/NimT family MFS transporter [Ferrovibrio sp.]|uniref:MFS transporter n=1 Tax=Ferrovibrio sp. TaxID=1917215 RepID=UPI001B4A848E|nr:MFS transporter [Ferrovibrio sp.]MBP7064409.1 MFS transporter [Ferrovibrio sp.]